MATRGDVTVLLAELRRGDRGAFDELLPLVYRELHRMAHRQLVRRRPGQTLNTTALVHEAYLKLVDQPRQDWRERGHFIAVAATAMRHILIDHARQVGARKRGGGLRRTTLDGPVLAVDARATELLALDEALVQLSEIDPRLTRLVELRFFAGLSMTEVAEVLGVTPRTLRRDWIKARAVLVRLLEGGPEDGGGPDS